MARNAGRPYASLDEISSIQSMSFAEDDAESLEYDLNKHEVDITWAGPLKLFPADDDHEASFEHVVNSKRGLNLKIDEKEKMQIEALSTMDKNTSYFGNHQSDLKGYVWKNGCLVIPSWLVDAPMYLKVTIILSATTFIFSFVFLTSANLMMRSSSLQSPLFPDDDGIPLNNGASQAIPLNEAISDTPSLSPTTPSPTLKSIFFVDDDTEEEEEEPSFPTLSPIVSLSVSLESQSSGTGSDSSELGSSSISNNNVGVLTPAPTISSTKLPSSLPTIQSVITDVPSPYFTSLTPTNDITTIHPSKIPTKSPTFHPTEKKKTTSPTESPTRIPTQTPTKKTLSPTYTLPTSSPFASASIDLSKTIFYVSSGSFTEDQDSYDDFKRNLANLPSGSFLIHLGDLVDPDFYVQSDQDNEDCPEKMYSTLHSLISTQSPDVPVMLLTGDKSWEDCENSETALNYWQKHLTYSLDKVWSTEGNMGRNTMIRGHGFGAMIHRDEKLLSNFSFHKNSVLFIGLTLSLIDDADDNGWIKVQEINRAWILKQLSLHVSQNEIKAIVMFGHKHRYGSQERNLQDFWESISVEIEAFNIPTLFIYETSNNNWRFRNNIVDNRAIGFLGVVDNEFPFMKVEINLNLSEQTEISNSLYEKYGPFQFSQNEEISFVSEGLHTAVPTATPTNMFYRPETQHEKDFVSTFYVTADFYMEDLYSSGTAAGNEFDEDLHKFQKALQNGIPDRAVFLLHLGNFNDPDETQCDELYYREYANILRRHSNAPVFMILGDKDVDPSDCPVESTDDAKLSAMDSYYTYFNDFEQHWSPLPFTVKRQEQNVNGISNHNTFTVSRNYAFLHKQVLYVGLNMVHNDDMSDEEWSSHLIKTNFEWVMKQLSDYKDQFEALVMFGNDRYSSDNNEFFDAVGLYISFLGVPTLYLYETRSSDSSGYSEREIDEQANSITFVRVKGDEVPFLRVSVDVSRPSDPFSFSW